MSTLREAAQQALEALELAHIISGQALCDAAIAALREALAQEQADAHTTTLRALLECCLSWEPDACVLGNVTAQDAAAALRAALAQQDEPVWMHPWPPVRAQQAEPQTIGDALTLPRATAQAYENGYKAGVAHEREACAQVCEARFVGDLTREDMEARRCAAAIRARGNT